MSKTTTISCRVPVDVANTLKKSAKARGLTTSKAMTELITQPAVPSTQFAKGGQIEVPSDIHKTLATFGGGTAIGLLVYQLLSRYMPRDKYTEEEVKQWSAILGISAGVLGAIGIHNLNPEE